VIFAPLGKLQQSSEVISLKKLFEPNIKRDNFLNKHIAPAKYKDPTSKQDDFLYARFLLMLYE